MSFPSRSNRSVASRYLVTAGLLLAAMLPNSCGPPNTAASAASSPARPLSFSFEVPGTGKRVDSATTRGRATMLLLMTTYDLACQVMATRVAQLQRSARPRSNAAAIAMEPPSYAHLLEAYRATLQLPYPVAIADFATLGGTGPFGAVDKVPVVVFLNRYGVETARLPGEQHLVELQRALEAAQQSDSR